MGKDCNQCGRVHDSWGQICSYCYKANLKEAFQKREDEKRHQEMLEATRSAARDRDWRLGQQSDHLSALTALVAKQAEQIEAFRRSQLTPEERAAEDAQRAQEKAEAEAERVRQEAARERREAEEVAERKRREADAEAKWAAQRAADAEAVARQPDPLAMDSWDRQYEARQNEVLGGITVGCMGLLFFFTLFVAC